jgi:hypothetical protein
MSRKWCCTTDKAINWLGFRKQGKRFKFKSIIVALIVEKDCKFG